MSASSVPAPFSCGVQPSLLLRLGFGAKGSRSSRTVGSWRSAAIATPESRDYSHAGGFHGLRWLRISSTSSVKSGSRTGALPISSSCALANAMHSEMLRRTGSAARRTATGRSPFSMMTSAPPHRTRAIKPVAFLLADLGATKTYDRTDRLL